MATIEHMGPAFWWQCPRCGMKHFGELAPADIADIGELDDADLAHLGIDPVLADRTKLGGELVTLPEVLVCENCGEWCESEVAE